MRFLFAVLCAALMGGPAFAGQQTSDVGSQAAPWLNLPNSARTAAMGCASVAVAGDVNTVSVNPAGLGGLTGQEASLMHNAYIEETSLEHVAYGLGLPAGSVAAAVDYMNFGSIQGYNEINGTLVPGSSFNPYGMAVDLGYGYTYGQFSAGAGLKMVTESLAGAGSNSALGGDLGLLWRQDPDSGLSAGVAVQNVGGQLDGANLPTNYQAGLAYRLLVEGGKQCLTLAGDASVPSADGASESLCLGGEYSGDKLWALRAGYKFVGNNGIGGLSVGAGLTYRFASIDYAFVNEGVLGGANQISLNATF